MISRRDLLVKMGELETPESIIEKIEKYILDAANIGKREIEYMFTSKADELTRLAVENILKDNGYIVSHYKTSKIDFYSDKNCLVVSW